MDRGGTRPVQSWWIIANEAESATWDRDGGQAGAGRFLLATAAAGDHSLSMGGGQPPLEGPTCGFDRPGGTHAHRHRGPDFAGSGNRLAGADAGGGGRRPALAVRHLTRRRRRQGGEGDLHLRHRSRPSARQVHRAAPARRDPRRLRLCRHRQALDRPRQRQAVMPGHEDRKNPLGKPVSQGGGGLRPHRRHSRWRQAVRPQRLLEQ